MTDQEPLAGQVKGIKTEQEAVTGIDTRKLAGIESQTEIEADTTIGTRTTGAEDTEDACAGFGTVSLTCF